MHIKVLKDIQALIKVIQNKKMIKAQHKGNFRVGSKV